MFRPLPLRLVQATSYRPQAVGTVRGSFLNVLVGTFGSCKSDPKRRPRDKRALFHDFNMTRNAPSEVLGPRPLRPILCRILGLPGSASRTHGAGGLVHGRAPRFQSRSYVGFGWFGVTRGSAGARLGRSASMLHFTVASPTAVCSTA